MKPITIVGGGLAGLTLGIRLRESNVPVVLHEAGTYPRHRVCGEFISGAGVETLRSLGLSGREARSVAFFYHGSAAGEHELPYSALCLSRFELDAALAARFREFGGDLRHQSRVQTPPNNEGVVLASGRRARATVGRWKWFGLKAHVTEVALSADLEMHVGTDAYVGLCRLADGVVNVCGLFRRSSDAPVQEPLAMLRGTPGSALHTKMAAAQFDRASLCSVAGLSLSPETISPSECRIGDALTMIPPITGNGMSMAFESAELAAESLARYSAGSVSWNEATVTVASKLDAAFSKRLRWAARLHRIIFSPLGSTVLPLLFRAEPVWRASFAVTR